MSTVIQWPDNRRDMAGPLPEACPRCAAAPFAPFLRGRVFSHWRRWLRRPCFALICWDCKEIVGWER